MKHILLFFIGLISLYSCKNDPCPAFPQHLLQSYGPEEMSELIHFEDNNKDIAQMMVNSTWASEATDVECGFGCECTSNGGYLTQEWGPNPFHMNFDFEINLAEESGYIKYSIYDGINGTDVFIKSVEKTNVFDSTNAKVFGDTIVIEKAQYKRFNKIIIIKGIGLHQVFDATNNQVFTRVIE